jgi:NTP pyrophosphatase (non-canonical NTP hydrolase)
MTEQAFLDAVPDGVSAMSIPTFLKAFPAENVRRFCISTATVRDNELLTEAVRILQGQGIRWNGTAVSEFSNRCFVSVMGKDMYAFHASCGPSFRETFYAVYPVSMFLEQHTGDGCRKDIERGFLERKKENDSSMEEQTSSVSFLDSLREASSERGREWDLGSAVFIRELLFRATELGGEAGEVLNYVKKYERFRRGMKGGIDRQTLLGNLTDELADVFICTDRLAALLEVDLEEAVVSKFNRTSEKYGLTTKLKENRADG